MVYPGGGEYCGGLESLALTVIGRALTGRGGRFHLRITRDAGIKKVCRITWTQRMRLEIVGNIGRCFLFHTESILDKSYD